MAFDLRQFLGLGRKRPNIQKFTGTQPFASLKEIPEQKEFLKSLRERIAGVGVGFREKELSAATSPFAAARRAGLKEQTIPLISAQASARGLGRSTIPVSRIATLTQVPLLDGCTNSASSQSTPQGSTSPAKHPLNVISSSTNFTLGSALSSSRFSEGIVAAIVGTI